MDRGDGWPGAARALRPAPADVRGLDHDLAYRALAERRDRRRPTSTRPTPRSRAYELRVLDDDRRFFPRYDAVLLYRADLPRARPPRVAALARLRGPHRRRRTMVALNARAKLDACPEATVAADFLAARVGGAGRRAARARARADRGAAPASTGAGRRCRCWRRSRSPCRWASWPRAGRRARPASSLGAAGGDPDDPVAGAAGVHDPAARHRRAAGARGAVPLQPAADRAQHARGLVGIPARCASRPRRSACRRGARLRLVELPLALPLILAGIKTRR